MRVTTAKNVCALSFVLLHLFTFTTTAVISCFRMTLDVNVLLSDCAVCSKDYVRTLSHRCSKCSSNTSFGTAVFGVFAGLAGVLLVLFLYYMIRIERGRTNRNSTGRFRKILAIQSLKIIIVSWQIITQVKSCGYRVLDVFFREYFNEITF